MRFNSKKINTINEYTCGVQPRDEHIIKLNTNENPYAPSKNITKYLQSFDIKKLVRYSDPTCLDLRKALAIRYDISPDNIYIGNGSYEILYQIFMAFLDDNETVLYPDITYGFYNVYSSMFNINTIEIPLNEDFTIDLDKYNVNAKMILIANPNAPTGIAIEKYVLEDYIKANDDKLIVIDEAYVDFGAESCSSLVNKYDNLIVVKTLSKSAGLAGLRIGYCFANIDIITTLNKVKNCLNPYNVDTIAQNIARISVQDSKYFLEIANIIINNRNWFTNELKLLGFECTDSKANFVFIKHSKLKAKDIYDELFKQGIYIRYFNNNRINNYIRISIGSFSELKQTLEVLKNIIYNTND